MYHRQGREDDHHFFHLWGAGGIGGLSSWEVSTITQIHQSEFLTNSSGASVKSMDPLLWGESTDNTDVHRLAFNLISDLSY